MEGLYKVALSIEGKEKHSFGEGAYTDVCETDQIKFGELHVPAGGKAGYDAGHPGADEVFYIAQGEAEVNFPESGESVTLKQGEYVLIPRGKPHVVKNCGDIMLKLLYFGIIKTG